MLFSIVEHLQLLFGKRKRLLVIGDSHCEVFKDASFKRTIFSNYYCFVKPVGGATISGLDNPNSKTNSKATFLQTFKRVKPDILIVQLGEVDTGFVLWYRAEKYNVDVNEMLSLCLQNYTKFIEEVSGKYLTIIVSAPLPTIKDNQDWGEVANLRKEVVATQQQRTKLTILFNSKLEKLAPIMNVKFINLDSESLGEDGVVSSFLENSNSSDHHYDRSAYAALLIRRLKKLIKINK